MLTNEDIQKIIKANQEVFATKEDLKAFVTKEDLRETSSKLLSEIFSTKEDLENFKDEMKEGFSNLQTSVDSYAKKADSFFQEMVMLSRKVDRQEEWIHQIAQKVGVQLKY